MYTSEQQNRSELGYLLEVDVFSLRTAIRTTKMTPEEIAALALDICSISLNHHFQHNVKKTLLPHQLPPVVKRYEKYIQSIFEELVSVTESVYDAKTAELVGTIFTMMRELKADKNKKREVFAFIKSNIEYQDQSKNLNENAKGLRNAVQEMMQMREQGQFLKHFEEKVIGRYLKANQGEFSEQKLRMAEDQSVEHFIDSSLGTIRIHLNLREMYLLKMGGERDTVPGISEEEAKVAINILFDALLDFFAQQYPESTKGDETWQQYVKRAHESWDISTFAKDFSGWRPNFLKSY